MVVPSNYLPCPQSIEEEADTVTQPLASKLPPITRAFVQNQMYFLPGKRILLIVGNTNICVMLSKTFPKTHGRSIINNRFICDIKVWVQ